jgi:ribonucleoside-diphosphate reductase alpha chain
MTVAITDTPQRTQTQAIAPGSCVVQRRNGTHTPYDDSKIITAMTRAFLAVEGQEATASPRIREVVTQLAEDISRSFGRRMPGGGLIHIETIQDMVELAMMRAGEQQVARAYVLYREQRRQAKLRSKRLPQPQLMPAQVPRGSPSRLVMAAARRLQ